MTNLGGNALLMRELNTNLVRRTLKALRQATRHQIAEATGLSTVTIASILQKLVDEHIAFEVGLVASMGGRPAQQFRFNENHAHVLVLFTHEQDGLDMLYIRVANLFGVSLYALETPLTDIHLRTFEPYIDAALQEYPTIQALGFGLPGIEREGQIIFADYPSLVGTPFLAHYRDRYQLPVFVENDVNAACAGYCHHAAVEAEAATIYFYFPQKYPPGSGIYLDGKLYKGFSNYAGEVAMLPFGIDWRDADLYASPERICEAVTLLVVASCSLLNPQAVILYGTFLTDEHLAVIRQKVSERLPSFSMPDVLRAADFTLDYQNGMVEGALALLEPRLSLSL